MKRMDSTSSPRVVILGAGFGGLRAAIVLGKKSKELGRKGYQITLIDKNRYHTYTPLLYEISTTSKETANYLDLKSVTTYSVEGVLLGFPVEFIQGEVKNIDLAKKEIHLEGQPASAEATARQVDYEYLILALGAETNFFNIPGLKENALELKSFNGALKIRDTVWEKVEGAAQNEAVDIVIGGAGSTGVELAGEIQEWIAQLRKEGYLCRTGVTLIDASPTILKSFDAKIIEKATRRLRKLGTNIITNERISKIEASKAFLESGKIVSFDILIWTGGVKANSLIDKLPLKRGPQGRMGVNGELLCLTEKPDLNLGQGVYAIGDIACFQNSETATPVPMVARAAIIQGTIAAKNIIADIKGKSHLRYDSKDYPYIIPIGGKYAIAKIGPFIITGFFGWILKGLVELNYLDSIMPLTRALRIWLKGLKVFIQNDRLG